MNARTCRNVICIDRKRCIDRMIARKVRERIARGCTHRWLGAGAAAGAGAEQRERAQGVVAGRDPDPAVCLRSKRGLFGRPGHRRLAEAPMVGGHAGLAASRPISRSIAVDRSRRRTSAAAYTRLSIITFVSS